MADTQQEENNNGNLERKDLFIFLASGVFAKLHKEFLAPASETSWSDLVVNWFHQILPSETDWGDVVTGWIDPVHKILHTLIGIAIQIVLLLWVVKFIIVAGKAVCKAIKDRWK